MSNASQLFKRHKGVLFVFMLLLVVNSLSFAQTATPSVTGPTIDFAAVLPAFWETFSSFFSAFAPIILPILAIPAAFAFLMFLGNLLSTVFNRLKGMSGGGK